MPRLIPHLWYARDALEAARFYASILPDSRVDAVETLAGDSPSGPEGSVQLVQFTLLGQPVWAISAGPHHDFNDAVSFIVECDTQDEIDGYWDALGAGGRHVACGWLTDRYGLRWQITGKRVQQLMQDPDRDKVRRVTKALLSMVKVELSVLEAAAEARA
ncbi:MAG: VOC family protein [Caulobacteraceae bacterium]|nr:VOC family protein [Caulobacteraceae bacterium]